MYYWNSELVVIPVPMTLTYHVHDETKHDCMRGDEFLVGFNSHEKILTCFTSITTDAEAILIALAQDHYKSAEYN